jgi:cell division protein FtsZ
MLSEPLLPTVRYEIPEPRIVPEPRISSPQSTAAMPKFASEPEISASSRERDEAVAAPEPELRAVPASVFDDDFFRAVAERTAQAYSAVEETSRVDAGVRETVYLQQAANVQTEAPLVEAARSPYSSAAPVPVDGEPDELDIPAFLRRGH